MHALMNKLATHRERGDTLVEVLIAIAVVSLILGGAYVTTNRSLQATRSAQERAVALKLAESQIERLKALMSTSSASTVMGIPAGTAFCIGYTTNKPVNLPNNECDLNTDGTYTGVEPIFHISITRGGTTGNDFVLSENWADVSGRNSDSLQLRYRVYD